MAKPRVLTYLDTGVFIAAFKGSEAASPAAIEVLSDVNRKIVASPFLRLELISRNTFNKLTTEVEFYSRALAVVEYWISCDSVVLDTAMKFASRQPLGLIDAVHLASASIVRVDEFITTEARSKPLFQFREVNAISLQP